MTVNQANL